MGLFYSEKLQIDLSWWERRPLFPAWHFLNFISDMIIIVGTAYKIGLDYYVSLKPPILNLFLCVSMKTTFDWISQLVNIFMVPFKILVLMPFVPSEI